MNTDGEQWDYLAEKKLSALLWRITSWFMNKSWLWLKHNHREKSMQAPFIIYANMEPLLYFNNPKRSSITKPK